MISLPNPTKIMTQLTSEQLVKVKEQFCLNIVDNMDLDTLIEIVHEQLMQSYDDWDEVEFKEEVVSYYNEDTTEYNNIVNEINPYTTSNPEALTDYGVGK
jgi:hypothetical protein